MSFKIDCKVDYKQLEKVMKNISRLREREVAVGYYDEDIHEDSGENMGTIANWMEYGTRSKDGGMHIPARKFMNQGASIWKNSIEEESAKVVARALQGKEAQLNAQLEKIGKEGEIAIKDSMDLQNFRALAPSTITAKRARGSRYPTTQIMDTGELYEGMKTKIK